MPNENGLTSIITDTVTVTLSYRSSQKDNKQQNCTKFSGELSVECECPSVQSDWCPVAVPVVVTVCDCQCHCVTVSVTVTVSVSLSVSLCQC